jgi:putative methionine-R-sulfoxide reductase with GAF domain
LIEGDFLDYLNAERKMKKLLLNEPKSIAFQKIVDFLHDSFEKYSWVGIYFLKRNELVLGPWRGKQATEHTTILLGTGICGAAAKTGKTELVDDVSKDKRYLSCFLSTRSEIVVPIKKMNVVVGEIDIDSDGTAAFNKNDVIFLEKVADMLGQHI